MHVVKLKNKTRNRRKERTMEVNDVFEDGNQFGESADNIGQDGNGQTQENSGNWEEQAKYFQSEKDKLAAENQKLKGYEEIGSFLESRPDVVKIIDAAVRGGGQPIEEAPPKIEISAEEFDPWEAYNDPASKSYQFRQQELSNTINKAVDSAVGAEAQKYEARQGMANLQNELKGRGFSPEQIKGFMEFTSHNPADYGLDSVIQMYNAVAGGDANVIPNTGLDNVRNTQNRPTPGGILDGNKPQVKDDGDELWKGIMGAQRGDGRLP